MTDGALRWAWFGLACAVVVIVFWASRYQFLDCLDSGCYVGDRSTGEVFYQGEEAASSPPVVVAEQLH